VLAVVLASTGSAAAARRCRATAPQPGRDAANPATLVAADRDSGWTLMGGGGSSPYPTTSLTGGALRLQGGFDSSTPSGGIGIAHAYASVPLSSLKTLSYDFRVLKRPDNNTVSAPTIHITALKANPGTQSGFSTRATRRAGRT
jgi:hypothetical protein